MKEVIAVSACLLGYNCKYDGHNNLNIELIASLKGKTVVPICPEVFGGLPTPRIPSEIQPDGRIINAKGDDVTPCFIRGKELAWALMQQHHATKVILKDGSPSCGYSTIYDGTFSNRKIPGMGETTKYLLQNGVTILNQT